MFPPFTIHYPEGKHGRARFLRFVQISKAKSVFSNCSDAAVEAKRRKYNANGYLHCAPACRTREVIGESYEFQYWTVEVVAQIDRQLEFLGANPLRPLAGTELTEKEKEMAEYRAKLREHIQFMETVLGRPSSEQEAEEALKAHEYYADEPITTE